MVSVPDPTLSRITFRFIVLLFFLNYSGGCRRGCGRSSRGGTTGHHSALLSDQVSYSVDQLIASDVYLVRLAAYVPQCIGML
jgi:hypothetical protein